MNRLLVSLFTLGIAVAVSGTAHADGNFAKKHPRRAEVRKRVNNQHSKNNGAVANGQISQQQANKLNRQDNRIGAQEHRQEEANGGHLTKAEQRRDNRELNKVNRERRQDEHKDATGGNNGATPAAPAAPATGQ